MRNHTQARPGEPAASGIPRDVVVIGTSAGGIAALESIAAGLPADFPGSVLIVMHLSPESRGSLPGFLAKAGRLTAANAEDGEEIRPNRIYVAPPDYHLIISDDRLRLAQGPKENRFRPAIDPLFRSAALAFGRRVVGVILTGYLDDGTAGLAAVKTAGGLAIVQDPLEAVAPSMPRSALRAVQVDHCLKLAKIAPMLVKLARGQGGEGGRPVLDEAPEDIGIETEIAAGSQAAARRIFELGDASMFSCPECHGALFRLHGQGPERFRCHTGHGFTAGSLAAALAEDVEKSLWTSVRSLQEQGMLLNHMAEQAHGEPERVAELRQRSRDALRRADLVRQALLPPAAHRPAIVDAVEQTGAVE